MAVPVTVNPRYGNSSKELCSIDSLGTLAKPAPTAKSTNG